MKWLAHFDLEQQITQPADIAMLLTKRFRVTERCCKQAIRTVLGDQNVWPLRLALQPLASIWEAGIYRIPANVPD